MDKYRVYFTGVGGQGTLLATRVLAEAAIQAGHDAVASEVHGSQTARQMYSWDLSHWRRIEL
jgi:Pyruvate/2-oxoacid:ferredoxin oxidoreductase gamma subunit